VDYIESHGFKKDYGTFSDVSTLGREFNLCTTNLSMGYYHEHTRHETLYCRIMNDTIQKTISLVAQANKDQKVWELPKTAIKSHSRYLDDYGYGDGFGCGGFYNQRKLKYGRKKATYTEEELARYPYLRDLEAWVGSQ
jgi:hypothetical protein